MFGLVFWGILSAVLFLWGEGVRNREVGKKIWKGDIGQEHFGSGTPS